MKEIEENTASASLSTNGWEELSDEELSMVVGGRTIFGKAISKVTGAATKVGETMGKVAGFVDDKVVQPIENSNFIRKHNLW